jgi:hypothetical protein
MHASLPVCGRSGRERRFRLCFGVWSIGSNAQPVDEDVDKSQNAGLPPGLIVHVAHAHKSTKEVLRADVFADFACRDRPVQQPADGLRQPIERMREELRVFVGSKSERRRHALFRGNELHDRPHPVTECIDGLGLLFQLFGKIGKLLHLAAVHRFEQGFARWEMPVEGADAHTGGARDGFEAGLRTAGAENRLCRLEDALAIPSGISARLSCPLFQLLQPTVQFRPLEKRRHPPYMAIRATFIHNT